MSSLIPKISIGVDTKREKFDLSSMTHTTSEIGYVQPTFSKLIVPKSKVRIGTRTGSRLSPLFVPTMGQIDIRHYHCFVPFSTLWTPFDAFITKTNYTLPDGSTYIPSSTPYFRVNNIIQSLLNVNSEFDDIAKDLTAAIYRDGYSEPCNLFQEFGTQNDTMASAFGTLWNNQTSNPSYLDLRLCNVLNGKGGEVNDGNDFFSQFPLGAYKLTNDGFDILTAPYVSDTLPTTYSYPSIEACDFTDHFRYNGVNYTVCYNFNGSLKRLRTIFMGLGYSFNPYDDQQVTFFKLLGFYKAYWSLFGVARSYNFFNTNCYKLIKYLSDHSITSVANNEDAWTLFVGFVVNELSSCTYTCPVDYFSASDITTQRGSQGRQFRFDSQASFEFGDGTPHNGSLGASTDRSTYNVSPNVVGSGIYGSAEEFALSQRIALRLLRFVNKNSVVGRKVSEILRTRYGISDIHNETHESVIRIGSSATHLEISPIYNQTDNPDSMPLGSYAGMCAGGNQSKQFTFETKEFGVLITLTSVVPKMGYFQGMFHENSDGINGSLEFYTPEFDALGWQAVRYNELIADRQFHNGVTGSHGTDLGIFGYMPTYSHLKVSQNRVLGDISLPHMQDSMLPYTLDRFYPQRQLRGGLVTYSQVNSGEYDADNNTPSFTVPSLPVNNPQSFRAGTQGNTNRIFTDFNSTDDHVIMQIFFDVHMTAPMKSIATSFDTYDEESTHSVSVGHE